MSAPRSVLKDAAIGLLITAGLLAALELGLRIFWHTQWRNHGNASYDDNRGWRGKKGYYDPQTTDLHYAGYTNSLGYRGQEWALKKGENVTRVIAVGDSVVLGFGNEVVDGHFPRYLGELLGARYEVLNAGVAANNSRQSEYCLREELVPYKPDVVLISVGLNDIADEYPGSLSKKNSYHWTRLLAEKSYLVRASVGFVAKVVMPRMKVNREDFGAMRRRNEEFVPATYKKNLKSMAEICRKNGAQAVFLTLPHRLNMKDHPQDDSTGPVTGAVPYIHDPRLYRILVGRYNEAIREVSRETGSPLVDMDREFGQMPDGAKYLIDHAHFSDEGCRLYARILHEQLKRKKVL